MKFVVKVCRIRAQDSLKSMSRQFESHATSICLEHITTMLNDYKTDKTNKWGSKDVAVSFYFEVMHVKNYL